MNVAKLDPLHDRISSVQLIDHMGDDLRVVNAARESMDKEKTEFDVAQLEGEKDGSDTRLLTYLAKHDHWTPYAHPQITLRIKMPLFVAREWYRHTVGFVRNEVSRRYVTSTPEFYIPTEWRLAPTNGIKQGSSDKFHEQSGAWTDEATSLASACANMYYMMLEAGIAPELARTILPVSMYTEFIETASLYAYARLCRLRDAPDAQREIAAYARAVAELIQPLFPVAWRTLTTNA